MNFGSKQFVKFAAYLIGAAMPLTFASAGTCPAGTSCDPGPRPVGAQKLPLAGPLDGKGTALLTTPVNDTRQPPDAAGNEGAGQVLGNAGGFTGFWFRSLAVFSQTATVNGVADTNGNRTITGLGPAFNGTSCFMCHSQPAIGGTSPGTGTPGFTKNPQLIAATAFPGPTPSNLNPADLSSFIKPNGPIREVRFILDENASTETLDGGVHELFSIQGRSDAPSGCSLAQPDFNTQIANNNVIFRIPTPTFGLGLVENVADQDLVSNAELEAFDAEGIASGLQNAVLNRNGNDGTVTRFGWKAQNKSLLLFAGEAANVELGITNELFQNEKVPGTGCTGNAVPEDHTRVDFPATGATFPNGLPAGTPDADALISSAIENFAVFMRINGSPAQCDFASGIDTNGNAVCAALSSSAQAGLQVFNKIGCNLCHTQSFTTQPSSVGGLSNRTFSPFSDFGLHHMGATLADGVTQGLAGPDMFRTAPLWGLGQRLFFMHDGRTSDLKQAIQAHSSDTSICFATSLSQSFTVQSPVNSGASRSFSPSASTNSCGSEANGTVTNFNNLNVTDQQNLLNFLRSL